MRVHQEPQEEGEVVMAQNISLSTAMNSYGSKNAKSRVITRPTKADRRGSSNYGPGRLEQFNESNAEAYDKKLSKNPKLPKGTKTLHPTKGYRFMSDKRSKAALACAQLRSMGAVNWRGVRVATRVRDSVAVTFQEDLKAKASLRREARNSKRRQLVDIRG